MPGSRAKQALLLGAAIVAAGAIAYLPALGAGFVFDDHTLLLGPDASVRRPLAAIWFGKEIWDYWPLTWTSFWIEWRLTGGQPWVSHAINVALHCAAAVLVWRVLAALRIPGAWLAALLFAVHPVTVESVAWVSERKNVLSAVLVLAAALRWIRSDDEGPGVPWAALGLFVLALLTKTSVVVLPVVLAGVIFARRGRIERAEWLRLAPFFAASLAAGAATLWFQHQNAMKLVLLRPRGAWERLGGAGWAILSYLERALVPLRVWFVYPDWPADPRSPWFYLPLAITIALPLAIWAVGGSWRRPLLLAYAYFVALLLPIVGLVDIAYFGVSPMSNHLQYLAMIGPLALVASALAAAAGKWPVPSRVFATVLVAALTVASFRRAETFESDLTLWREAAHATPSQVFAVSMYTRILRERGDREEAARELSRAAAASADLASRLRILSLAFQDENKLPEAFGAAAEAERLRPDPAFQHELGWKLMRGREILAASAVFEGLVRMVPRSPHVHYSAGVALGASGRLDEALVELRRAAELAPGNAKVQEGLAMALFRLGRLEDARQHAALSLGVPPADVRVDAQLARWRELAPDSSAPR
jgi:tetratricopeptide (TPR) repeat protein